MSAKDYDLAFSNLRTNQFIAAHDMFVNMAQQKMKSDSIKAAILHLLAAECKIRQGKDAHPDFEQAANLFLGVAKKTNDFSSKPAYLCASKCLLKIGNFDDAKKYFDKAQQMIFTSVASSRPVIIIDDSKDVALKLESYITKLGYSDYQIFHTGKDAIKGCEKILGTSKSPIILLDMGLPDIEGDAVAEELLKKKTDLQIIVITADEKTTERVNKTISSGVSAFIQKPFTIDEVKNSLDIVESEYKLLEQ